MNTLASSATLGAAITTITTATLNNVIPYTGNYGDTVYFGHNTDRYEVAVAIGTAAGLIAGLSQAQAEALAIDALAVSTPSFSDA